MCPLTEMSRVWTGLFSVWATIHRLQRVLLQYLDSPKIWAGKAASGVCHFIPVYFHSMSVEMSEVSDNLVQSSSSFMPRSSERAYTT